MNVKLSFTKPAEIETECLVVLALDHGDKDAPQPKLQADGFDKAVGSLLTTGEFTAKPFEAVVLYSPQGIKAQRVVILGAGKAKKFDVSELRKAVGAAVRQIKGKNIKSFTFAVPDLGDRTQAVRAATEGAIVGDFDVDTYKSDRKDQKIDTVTLVVNGKDDQLHKAVEQGRILAESQNFARELVNEPSNRMTPHILGERAQKMAAEVGLKCDVFGREKLEELKMGSFLSVAQGSDEPPALILLQYEPEGASNAPVLGLVGKGITFDSGGISIKPGEGMEKMKYDMAGGATMLGAMRAIALLKPNVKVICIVCATENMPSGKAQKPGDVQFAMNGKSIEVINTDAEGRLVLADGLVWARQLGATHLIDAATLTGACVVALGYHNVGVFANNDNMYSQFDGARQNAGEKMWRMPLDAEYFEQIKSTIADIQNVGGRWGGAITAAKFLEQFVEETPWIHLDIAGTAWLEDNKPWIAKGPSGVAVRTLVEYARSLAENGGTESNVGFTGGTQRGSQKGSKAAQNHADSGAGL